MVRVVSVVSIVSVVSVVMVVSVVSVVSSDPRSKDGNVRFTMMLLKALSDEV